VFNLSALTHCAPASTQAHKTVYSQRDVPGVPIGAVPILAAAGVKGVSVGANGRVFPGLSAGGHSCSCNLRRRVLQQLRQEQ